MKKLFFILTFAAMATSCNDEETITVGETTDALVTRVSRSGITLLEFFYDVDKKLYRMNEYSLGQLIAYTIYEYNQGILKELKRYDAEDHSLDYRIAITLDNFQRVIKAEQYHSSSTDQVTTFLTFEYDLEGRLKIKKFFVYTQVSNYEEYTYDDKGNGITKVTTYNPNEEGEFKAQLDYTPGNKTMPDLWKEHTFILEITGGFDEPIKNMFISNTRYRVWNTASELLIETSIEASGQEYDDDGNLVRQIITRKNVLDPENPDIIEDMSYDFN